MPLLKSSIKKLVEILVALENCLIPFWVIDACIYKREWAGKHEFPSHAYRALQLEIPNVLC